VGETAGMQRGAMRGIADGSDRGYGFGNFGRTGLEGWEFADQLALRGALLRRTLPFSWRRE
jgi:hypothetical protein